MYIATILFGSFSDSNSAGFHLKTAHRSTCTCRVSHPSYMYVRIYAGKANPLKHKNQL